LKPKIIFIFVGLPRKIEVKLNFIQYLIDEYKALVIFSSNEEILKYKLPNGSKVIINENNNWYQSKLKEVCTYPEYKKMLQFLRLSNALRYIEENKMASENTIIFKLRTDVLNLEHIKIPTEISNQELYMDTDYAFASTYKVMQMLDKFFFSVPENFIDLNKTIDVTNQNFLQSNKDAARFEWLIYPSMISTLLPARIFKYFLKTKMNKFLWVGPKNFNKQICLRYYKDIGRFQSEVVFLWSILKCNLVIKSISSKQLLLYPDRHK
jgi:hypothetical protein